MASPPKQGVSMASTLAPLLSEEGHRKFRREWLSWTHTTFFFCEREGVAVIMATHPLPLLGRGMGGGHGHIRLSFSGREKTTQACWTTREKAVVSPSPILAALPEVQDQVPDIHADLLRPLMGHTRMELLQLGGLREPLVDRGGSVANVPTAAVVCPGNQGIGSRQARGPKRSPLEGSTG